MNVTRRLTPPVGLKPRNVWRCSTDPAGEIAGAAGDDPRDRAAALDAFGRELLLALPANHEELRRIDPPIGRRNLVRRNEMRATANPDTDVTCFVRIEARAVTLNRALREDAALGDEERTALGPRIFRLDEGRNELAGEIFRDAW